MTSALAYFNGSKKAYSLFCRNIIDEEKKGFFRVHDSLLQGEIRVKRSISNVIKLFYGFNLRMFVIS